MAPTTPCNLEYLAPFEIKYISTFIKGKDGLGFTIVLSETFLCRVEQWGRVLITCSLIDLCFNMYAWLIFCLISTCSMQYYMEKTYNKTGSLISNSCKAIALLLGQTTEAATLAYEYGKNLVSGFFVSVLIWLEWVKWICLC